MADFVKKNGQTDRRFGIWGFNPVDGAPVSILDAPGAAAHVPAPTAHAHSIPGLHLPNDPGKVGHERISYRHTSHPTLKLVARDLAAHISDTFRRPPWVVRQGFGMICAYARHVYPTRSAALVSREAGADPGGIDGDVCASGAPLDDAPAMVGAGGLGGDQHVSVAVGAPCQRPADTGTPGRQSTESARLTQRRGHVAGAN